MSGVRIFGGLFFESLVKQDKYFVLQMELFREGFIQGVQLRVAHPLFTTSLVAIDSLSKVLAALPDGLEVFIHYGAQNVGVDFGQTFDEEFGPIKREIYNYGKNVNWSDWNRETFLWGLEVAKAAEALGKTGDNGALGVVHPGYGQAADDATSREQAVFALNKWGCARDVALENVPALATGKIGGPWGFGGTPQDMADLLNELFGQWRCLIDFTHLAVTVNQASAFRPLLPGCLKLERVLEAYWRLPHCSICHFSGLPSGLVDDHDHLYVPPPDCVREAIRNMEAVCLELAWQPETARQQVEKFRELYLR